MVIVQWNGVLSSFFVGTIFLLQILKLHRLLNMCPIFSLHPLINIVSSEESCVTTATSPLAIFIVQS